jgi:predicted Rossmann fold flavoprotein
MYNPSVKKVIVVGAGAAGFMAAIKASEKSEVYLLEKMSRPGLKILVSGKGRCNVTNAGSIDELISAFGRNGRFLYHSFSVFSNLDLINFISSLGVETVVERGKRVFPKSGKSKDVLNALKEECLGRGVEIVLNNPAKSIIVKNNSVHGVILSDRKILYGDAVILATGGKSFPGLGTTGDGYEMLKEVGHTITKLYPGLVPLVAKGNWIKELEGLSLRNVMISARLKEKCFSHFGDMVFTRRGISGPIVLSLSSEIVPYLSRPLTVEVDLKPALREEILDARLVREFKKQGKRKFKNALRALIPASLIPVFVRKSEVNGDKKCSEITKEERKKVLLLLKRFPIKISGTEGFEHAIVTKGGVDLREVDPRTMRSKIINNLFIVGELLDIDAVTGGYNLQAAFSTGFVAGSSID